MFFDKARQKYVAEIKPLNIHANDVDEDKCYQKLLKVCAKRGVDPNTGKLLQESDSEVGKPEIELARPCVNKVGEIPRKASGVTPRKKKREAQVWNQTRIKAKSRSDGA